MATIREATRATRAMRVKDIVNLMRLRNCVRMEGNLWCNLQSRIDGRVSIGHIIARAAQSVSDVTLSPVIHYLYHGNN